jgi:hypothetical protein
MSTTDELSTREHDELRDLVLAGTQRIRPTGAHRAQFAAAGAALVLVGAITGGVITAALQSGDDPHPAVTPGPITPSVEDPQPTPVVRGTTFLYPTRTSGRRLRTIRRSNTPSPPSGRSGSPTSARISVSRTKWR